MSYIDSDRLGPIDSSTCQQHRSNIPCIRYLVLKLSTLLYLPYLAVLNVIIDSHPMIFVRCFGYNQVGLVVLVGCK